MENKEETKPMIQPRHHTDPRATVNLAGLWYAPEEVEQVKRQNAERQAEYRRGQREVLVTNPEGQAGPPVSPQIPENKKEFEKKPPRPRRPDRAGRGL